MGQSVKMLVGRPGHRRLERLGIDTSVLSEGQRPLVRSCLDWTQRTHHLGGSVGAALLTTFVAERWIRRHHTRRDVIVTPSGRRALRQHFGVDT